MGLAGEGPVSSPTSLVSRLLLPSWPQFLMGTGIGWPAFSEGFQIYLSPDPFRMVLEGLRPGIVTSAYYCWSPSLVWALWSGRTFLEQGRLLSFLTTEPQCLNSLMPQLPD